MALIVNPEVAALLAADPTPRARFVAGCVERNAQLFTGMRATEPGRERDTARYLEILDELWDDTASPVVFEDSLRFIESLPEMQPDQELIDPTEIASGCAVLVMRHACRFRASGDVNDALLCGHACLTLAGLNDANVVGLAWRDEEDRFQLMDAAGSNRREDQRSVYQQISRERVRVVLQRT